VPPLSVDLSLKPVLDLQALDPLEFLRVVGYEDRTEEKRVGGDEKIHRANRRARLLEKRGGLDR
jgi:hypothetical protein